MLYKEGEGRGKGGGTDKMAAVYFSPNMFESRAALEGGADHELPSSQGEGGGFTKLPLNSSSDDNTHSHSY